MSNNSISPRGQHGLSKKSQRNNHVALHAGAVNVTGGISQPVPGVRDSISEEKHGLHAHEITTYNTVHQDDDHPTKVSNTQAANTNERKHGLRRKSHDRAGAVHSTSRRGLEMDYHSATGNAQGATRTPKQASPVAEHVSGGNALPTLRGLAKNRRYDFSNGTMPNRQTQDIESRGVEEATYQGIGPQESNPIPISECYNPALALEHEQRGRSTQELMEASDEDNQSQAAELHQQQRQASNDDLAVAYPVGEGVQSVTEQMPLAEQFDPQKRTQQLDLKWRKRLRLLAILGLAIVIIAATVVAVITVSAAQPSTLKSSNFTKTTAPTLQSIEDYVLSLLPDFTIHAINDPETAQRKAYEWLLQHPDLLDFTDARILRRFGLACLYYSTEGERWAVSNKNWMDINANEFTWEQHGYNATVQHVFDSFAEDKWNNETFSFLGMDRNGMKGTIPPELFFGLPDLELLDLGYNELTGTIPTEIGVLSNLEYLSFRRNLLTARLPKLEHLGKFKVALVDYNSLTGIIPPIPSSTETFMAEKNLVSGPIPTEIGLAENLTIFYFQNNLLNSTIPTEIGETALVHLVINDNFLSGTLPSEMGKLDALEYLEAFNNIISGTLPPEIGSLGSLEVFDLHNNLIVGTLPSEIGLMESLEYFQVHNNAITAAIPSELGLPANLTVLVLMHNSLVGSIPSELGMSTSLAALALNGNELTGSFPSELGQLSSLIYLDLGDNAHNTGSIPREFGFLGELQDLYLNGNTNLETVLPSEFGLLPNLLQLWLYDSNIKGSIPSELGQLGMLQDLRLHRNSLTGQLPSELGGLGNLTNLDLSENKLMNGIPSEIASLAVVASGSLQSLNISHNSFTGIVPEEFCSLEELSETAASNGILLSFDFTCSAMFCGCSCACNQ